MTQSEIIARLEAATEPSYRDFHCRLVPGLDNMRGVRTPILRALAREIAQDDAAGYLAQEPTDDTYEETLLYGMVIGAAKLDFDRRLTYIARFMPHITNWALCDLFVSSLRFRESELPRLWAFLAPYRTSAAEFPARFAAVMLLRFFVRASWLPQTMDALAALPSSDYNARMGAAWALSECYLKFPAEGLDFLTHAPIPDWTRRKALQKILESRRLASDARAEIRALRDSL